MNSAFKTLKNTEMSVGGWLVGTAGIILVRIILENFSSPPSSSFLISDFVFATHLALFFWGLLLMLIIVLHLVTKESIVALSKLALYGLVIIWLPPIVDLLFSGRGGASLLYIFASGSELLYYWLTFFPLSSSAVTLGIGVEIVAVLAAIIFYVWFSTRSWVRTLLSAIGSYTAIFFWVSLPSLIKIVADIFNPTLRALGINEFLVRDALASSLKANFLHPQLVEVASEHQVYAVLAVSLVAFLILVASSLVWLFFYDQGKFIKVFLNSRFVRVAHYFAFILIGLLLGGILTVELNWVSSFSLAVLFLSFYLAWIFAVGVNDLEDLEIDRISNKTRPLVEGRVSAQEIGNINTALLALSLFGAALVGNYTFFLLLVFTLVYFIYSAPPLKLKRVPILSTFLIAIATLVATLSGFFFASADKTISSFPSEFLILILIGITLGAVAKDLKDIRGDEALGVKTLPVLLYQSPLRYAVSIVLALTYFSLPALVFNKNSLFIPGAILALISLILVKFKVREEFLFLIHFVFMGIIAYIVYL